MPKPPLTDEDRRIGRALGAALGARRDELDVTAEQVANDAGLPLDTLRRIEQGRVANPGLFTAAAVAERLGIHLGDLARDARAQGRGAKP